ncbi:uncharacterized protein LOC143085446 isoform X2 [Mytilus galloprovincialis]|uniref:uncharacterized protein LOC143085446 isoform X2 n=1 Tax=Mytilus galloprovincialis TaxID=29158 RepID=UPI003F7B3DF0
MRVMYMAAYKRISMANTNGENGGVVFTTLRSTTPKKTGGNEVFDSKKEEDNQKLANENKRLKNENKELNQRLLERNRQYDKLLAEVDAEKKQKNRLSMEREKTVNDFKKTSVDKSLKDETSRLQGELNKLNIENAGLRKEVDRIRTSLSKIAGERMTDGNPYITDLSDPQRPQKLAEKFNSLYDNSWTDAYEIINTEDMDEKMTCGKLIDIFKSCWDFCCEVARMQLSDLHIILLSLEEKESKEKKVKNDFPVQNSKIIKETRRMFAEQFIPTLCESYWQRQKDTGLVKDLQPYVDKCIELCWYSAISDPPLVYAFDANTNVDDFRGYTKSGDEIDYVVWPSMYLHEYGPLLYKGVVQYKMTDKHEDKPEPQKTDKDDVTDKTDVKPELQEKTEDRATDKMNSKPECEEQTADQMTEKLDGKPKLQEKPEDHVAGKIDVKLEPQEKTEIRETDKTDDKPELYEKNEENVEKNE